MIQSSASPDRSLVIHSNVKETLIHTYGDVLDSVNEKIFNRFRKILIKTPVVCVRNQIPDDVLDWYKINVFGQTIDKVVQKLPEKSTVTSEDPIIKLNKDAKIVSEVLHDEDKSMEFEESNGSTEESSQSDQSFQCHERPEPVVNQQSLQLPKVSSVTPEDPIIKPDNQRDKEKNKDNESPGVLRTLQDENKSMKIEDSRQLTEESSQSESYQSEKSIIKPMSIQSSLQLSEESSNDSIMDKDDNDALKKIVDDKRDDNKDDKMQNGSTNLENSSSDSVNLEIMNNLIASVLETIADEDKSMEIEDSKQLIEESSQLAESSQSFAEWCEEQTKPKINQSSLQLSEESSNDSIGMDKDDEDDEDVKKKINDDNNDDKMQNIKFNSNVLATIEDENNVLDFEDI